MTLWCYRLNWNICPQTTQPSRERDRQMRAARGRDRLFLSPDDAAYRPTELGRQINDDLLDSLEAQPQAAEAVTTTTSPITVVGSRKSNSVSGTDFQ